MSVDPAAKQTNFYNEVSKRGRMMTYGLVAAIQFKQLAEQSK